MGVYSLLDFVDQHGGIVKTGKLLGIHANTIRYWLKGKGYPRVEIILKIEMLSKGRLKFTTIIDNVHSYARGRK